MCRYFGSSLYGFLVDRCAIAFEQPGPLRDLMQSTGDDVRFGSFLVQMLAAVHKLVIQGKAPELGRIYPSAGGVVDLDRVWEPFSQTVSANLPDLSAITTRPVQINDIDRSAGLLGGFALVAQQTGMPLRLLEIGASGGLNLRGDRYFYEWCGGNRWGDPESAVRFGNIFREGYPAIPQNIEIAERRGCDLNPIDPTSSEGELTLLSYLYPDETDRFHDLRGAIAIARELPCAIDKAHCADWLRAQLSTPLPGVVTLVFQSMVSRYLSESEQQRTREIIDAAGTHASRNAPLAWLRMEHGENQSVKEGYEIRLRIYPGFGEHLIARFHHACHVPSVEWLLQ